MLIQHLAMLEAEGFLVLPSIDEKENYYSYAGFSSPPLLPQMVKGAGNGRHEVGEDGMAKNELDVDDMEEDLRRVQFDLAMHTSAKIGRAKAFLRWMRSLVNHFAALDIISAYSKKMKRAGLNVEFSLVSVKPPPRSHDAVGNWKATVEELASHTVGEASTPAFDAKMAIEVIEG